MNELALFAGAGGGILGGHLLGWRTVCAVEWEAYPASVLVARQNDKILPSFPIWDDVQTFDGKPWQGIVDVVSGGFPCQDISVAGNGDGLDGERSGMWREMARIIGEVRPRFVFVENSPMLTTRGLGTVLRDMAKLGYDAEWCVLGAADVGAKHQRNRIWIVGYTNNYGPYKTINKQIIQRKSDWQKENFEQFKRPSISKTPNVANSSVSGFSSCNNKTFRPKQQVLEKQLGGSGYEYGTSGNWWQTEPNLDRVVNGMADRVDRLKAIGNGQVPLCAATAWTILIDRINKQ
jgi:DNA (cytosine-5)-methyltransferase 1